MSTQSRRTEQSTQANDTTQQQQQGANREAEGPSNAQAQEQAGLGASPSSGSRFGPVAELDQGLANRLDNVTFMADMVLSDHTAHLTGLRGEADVQGCYDVIDYIDAAVAELADALDADDQEAQDKLLADLETYQLNLSDGSTVVECEGDILRLIEDHEVEAGIAAAAALGGLAAGLKEPVDEAASLREQCAAYLAQMEEVQGELQDAFVAEAAGELTGAMGDLLELFTGPCRAMGIVVGIGVDAVATLSEDMITAAFSTGGEGLSVIDTALNVGDELQKGCLDGAAQLLELGQATELLSAASDVFADLQQAEEVTDALDRFNTAADALLATSEEMLFGPVAHLEAKLGDEAVGQMEQVEAKLLEGGQWVREAATAHEEKAREIRSTNPGRYDRL